MNARGGLLTQGRPAAILCRGQSLVDQLLDAFPSEHSTPNVFRLALGFAATDNQESPELLIIVEQDRRTAIVVRALKPRVDYSSNREVEVSRIALAFDDFESEGFGMLERHGCTSGLSRRP